MAAAALGFASCDDKSDLGIAQVNPQEPIVEADGLKLAPSAAYTSTINLDNTVNQNIDILSVEDASGLPEGTDLEFELYIADNEAMENAEILPIEEGKVASNDIERTIVEFYSITPEVVKPWMGVAAYATIGKQRSRLGGEGFLYMKQQVDVLPVDEHLDIENSYFIGGSLSQKMDHSDLHAYVDNNFVAIFEVTAAQASAGFEWYVVPGSIEGTATPAQCYGPAATGNDLQLGAKGTITTPGRYRLVADMLAKTYTLTFAYEVLYTPGTGNGWSQANSMQLYTDNYSEYFGFTRTGADTDAKGEFKLDASLDWSMNWGLNGGKLTPNGDNIVTEPAGFYWVNANLNALTVSVLKVQSIGIIGLNGDWNTDIVMTPSSDMLTWTATMTADSDTNFKFRVNGGWDANLGGTTDKLIYNAANIDIAAGTYDVVLDLSKVPYTCTCTPK